MARRAHSACAAPDGYPAGMFKVIGILKRPEGTSFEDFRRWWFPEHAPKVKRWAGVVGYHINMAVTDDEEFDGAATVRRPPCRGRSHRRRGTS